MKLLALLFFIGLTAASRPEWGWKHGEQYTFEYKGRLLTGLPELASHYSGLGMKAKVNVYVKDPSFISMTVTEPEFVAINDVLYPKEQETIDGTNWRNLKLPEYKPVPEQYSQLLKSPVVFKVHPETGEIVSLTVSSTEPEWSVNFKKALLVLFQTKFDSTPWEVQQNGGIRGPHGFERPMYWKVKEESLDGECEVTYQVNELPTYIVKDQPDIIPMKEKCEGSEQYFEIVRTRDLDTCTKRAAFQFFKPGQYKCETTNGVGNCNNMWSRSSITRYIGCGDRNTGKSIIQTVINEGELNQNLLGYNTERMVTGTSQNLTLTELRPFSEFPEPQHNRVTISTLLYEYTKDNYIREGISSDAYGVSSEEQVKLQSEGRIQRSLLKDYKTIAKSLPRNFLSAKGKMSESKIPSDRIKQEVSRLIKEVSTELIDENTDMSKKQVNMKILSITRGLSMLSHQDIHEVYNIFSQSSDEMSEVSRNIFFDTVSMTGTTESIKFIRDLMKVGQMNKYQMTSFFVWVSHYLVTPTPETLEIIYRMVQYDTVKKYRPVYHAAVTGFSQLLQFACLSETRKTSYPTAVLGEFCHPDSEIVQDKWIPYLVEKLETSSGEPAERNVYLIALGLLPHKNVPFQLVPYMDKKASEVTELNRLIATYSLANVGYKDPETVMKVFLSVLTNQGETTEMRIAAFNSLIRMNPSIAMMQRIAAITREEPHIDFELLKTINIGFYTLAYEVKTEGRNEYLASLSSKARAAYAFIRKIEGVVPTSGALYTGDYLGDMSLGYEAFTTWIASESSFLPQTMYRQVTLFLDEYMVRSSTLGLRQKGAEMLWHRLPELLSPEESKESLEDKIKRGLSEEWKKIIEKLQLKSRDTEKMDGAFFISLFQSSPLIFNFDKLTIPELKRLIAPYIRNPSLLKNKIEGPHKLVFQRTMNVMQTEVLIPSEMGFPINIELHSPITFSMIGDLNVNLEREIQTVDLKAKTTYTSQYTGWVGTICPFSDEFVVTGLNQQSSIDVPGKLTFKLDIPQQKLTVSIKPTSETHRKNYLHFHMRPYTVRQKVDDFTPMVEVSQYKPIRSSTGEKTKHYQFGDAIGMKLESSIKTESRFTDIESVYDILRMYKFNPFNLFSFSWTTPALSERMRPSIRMHEYNIHYDPTTSSTKEIAMELRVGCGSKDEGESAKYHVLQVSEGTPSEEEKIRSPFESFFKQMLSYKVVSKEMDSTQVHPRRQELIKKSMERIETSQGLGVSVIYTLILKGRMPRTFSYQMVASRGTDKYSHGKINQKWDFRLQSPHAEYMKAMCIRGNAQVPILPIWNIDDIEHALIDFSYQNYLGFGSTCEESKIEVHGSARVTPMQKEFSLKSAEGKACKKLINERVPGAKTTKVCQEARLQGKTVDKVNFQIDYTNVPTFVKRYQDKAITYLELYFWPNYFPAGTTRSVSEERYSGDKASFSTSTDIQFKPDTPSFDMIITRPDTERVTFKDIRMKYPLNLFYPLKAGTSNVHLSINKALGVNGECRISDNVMTTYDNQTKYLHLDRCWHLLTADGTTQTVFGVLTKFQDDEGKRKEVKIFLKKHTLYMKPGTSGRRPHLYLNDEEVQPTEGKWIPMHSRGSTIGHVYLSSDNTIIISCPFFSIPRFEYNGDVISVTVSKSLKGKLTGMCGDFNDQIKADVTGPKKCVYSESRVEVASYRIQTDNCGTLPGKIREKLERETQQCTKFEIFRTQVTKSLKTATEKCTISKHISIERPGELCISQVPVTQCGPSCKSKQEDMVEKRVPFICVPMGRLASHYEKKIQSGKSLEELRGMDTTFSTKVVQPRHCTKGTGI